jgi:hypothetical protein
MDLKFDFQNIKAQGSTEYLVLLAVVLIIALVSIVLLGFFPGTSLDAKELQSKAYWSSASPIAIVEWAASVHGPATSTLPYFRIRNTGSYPIRITAIVSKNATGAVLRQTTFWGGNPGCIPSTRAGYNISDYFYLYPGEEKYFGYIYALGYNFSRCDYSLQWPHSQAVSLCTNSSNPNERGYFVLNEFGFEYIEYVEGKEIYKKQIAPQPLVIKCA